MKWRQAKEAEKEGKHKVKTQREKQQQVERKQAPPPKKKKKKKKKKTKNNSYALLLTACFSSNSFASLILEAMYGEPPLSGWFAIMTRLCASITRCFDALGLTGSQAQVEHIICLVSVYVW